MALFRRREIWWPTWQGMLALLLIFALLAFVFGLQIAGFLAQQRPARGPDGAPATTLIIEGWLDEADLAQALAAVQRGGYARVLTTGGPIPVWSDVGHWKTYAARAAAYLRDHGVDAARIVELPAPRTLVDRTWLNALTVRQWTRSSGQALVAVDVLTSHVHARRSRAMYQRALGDAVAVGVIAAAPTEFDTEHWWRSSAGAKTVLGESLSWAWTACCFWPAVADVPTDTPRGAPG